MKIKEIEQFIKDNIKSSEYYVIVSRSQGFNVRFSDNKIISNGVGDSYDLSITTIIDKKVGSSSTSDISKEGILECIKNSYNQASFSLVSEDYYPLVSDEYLDEKEIESPNFEFILSDIEKKLFNIFSKDPSLRVFGYITGSFLDITLFNSEKLYKRSFLQEFNYSMNIKDMDIKRSVWQGSVSSFYKKDELERLYNILLNDFKNTKIIKSQKEGRYNVILSPSALSDMLLYLLYFMSFQDACEGKSPFSSLKREKIFPDYITLYTDPNLKEMKSIPFLLFNQSSVNHKFDLGLSLKKEYLIKDGVLKSLISNRFFDDKMKNTENIYPPSNLILKGSSLTFEEFIKDIDDALYINNLWYIREVDPITGLLTGLTRDGVYTVKNGKIINSINNFRFNQSPIKVLENILKLSASYLTLPREFGGESALNVVAPYVYVKDFNLSSVSKAI